LADKLVALQYVVDISYETVRKALKKRAEALESAGLDHSAPAKQQVHSEYGIRIGCV